MYVVFTSGMQGADRNCTATLAVILHTCACRLVNPLWRHSVYLKQYTAIASASY